MEICPECWERIMWGECGCSSPKDTKAYQWLYKPKAESQWKLHDVLMTVDEANAEFQPLGENWEYKKLT